MIVLDASAAVDLLLQIGPNADLVATRVARPKESLHAPAIFDAEVLQAFRRYSRRNLLPPTRAREALRDLHDLRITRYPYVPMLGRMWDLRKDLSVFDAAYVALAEALDAPLVTTDVKLARIPQHRARIECYLPPVDPGV